MAHNATIYDVSRMAGVSTATVSRTYYEPGKVKEATRQRVYEAAKALHYFPNAIARAMVRQRTDKIAYLICKQGATILDEFYAGICDEVMRRTNLSDCQLLVSTASDWHTLGETAQSKQIEGVILAGDAPPELITELQWQNVAIVMVNNQVAGLDIPCIVSDERGAVRQVLEHLIDRGHRHIALVLGRFNPYITDQRYSAFTELMQEFGLPVQQTDVATCDANVESAAQAALRLLDLSERPTAIVAMNDMIAAGVIKAARRKGLRLPEDLAVTGMDDSSICTMIEPELTSAHIDCRKMGELCVERLMALLDGKTDVPRLTVVPTKLVVRRSS